MDFLLTPSGDITFEIYEKENKPFNISFITSKTKALTVSFHIDNSSKHNPTNSSLSIGFSVYNPTNDKTISTTTDEEYYEQQIKLRLMTPIGDLKSDITLGSYLENYRHVLFDNDQLIEKIKTEISRAIKDIVPNSEIHIKIKENTHYNFSNCILVSIYDKNRKKEFTYEI